MRNIINIIQPVISKGMEESSFWTKAVFGLILSFCIMFLAACSFYLYNLMAILILEICD